MNISPQIRGKKPSRLMLFATSRAGILATVIIVCTITFLLFYSGKVLKTSSVAPSSASRKKALSRGTAASSADTDRVSNTAASGQSLSDTLLYNQHLKNMSNGDSSGKWPVKAAYPNYGAILPYKRIIAFYGNLYSKRMGILGELPPAQMLDKLKQEVGAWQLADSSVVTVPALHYIAVTAQSAPGKNGKYRLRMPFHQIDSVLKLARAINAVVFLDIQSGQSTLQEEIPALEPYLKMPDVHLGIDPEFAMKSGNAPGKAVGTFDAADVNYASEYLSELVRKNNISPKILVVHRFTRGMITNYRGIHTRPEVQLVMHMDGWGGPAKKINTYKQFIYEEPVQFTGFKLFYKNDTKSNNRMLTPKELLQLKPRPVYIQYQ
jgi:hypothetical protein